MKNVVVAGNTVEFRADGRLVNGTDWTPEVAEQMAQAEGLSLSAEHWDVINTLRDYYHEYNTSPIHKLLRRELSKKYGPEKATDEALNALFPNGVQHQGTRLAGIPLAYLDVELDQVNRVQTVTPAGQNVSHFQDQFDFKGQPVKVYASGNLVNLEDWSEDLAYILAQKEGIQLSSEHFTVINFLRKFYFQYGVTPMVKVLIRHMAEELGSDAANKDHMYKLFPGGPAKQGSRIAGLPFPQGCIDD